MESDFKNFSDVLSNIFLQTFTIETKDIPIMHTKSNLTLLFKLFHLFNKNIKDYLR